MVLTNAEKRARWRERNLKKGNGNKLRAQFIFGAGALGVVLITLATRAIIRAAADREADRGVPRPLRTFSISDEIKFNPVTIARRVNF